MSDTLANRFRTWVYALEHRGVLATLRSASVCFRSASVCFRSASVCFLAVADKDTSAWVAKATYPPGWVGLGFAGCQSITRPACQKSERVSVTA